LGVEIHTISQWDVLKELVPQNCFIIDQDLVPGLKSLKIPKLVLIKGAEPDWQLAIPT